MDKLKLPQQYFDREDELPDEEFYISPRFKTHIDDATIDALCQFYRETLPASYRLLDLMSSWISHLPEDVSYKNVLGLGMNAAELAENKRLDGYCVQNLNTNTTLPYDDHSIDGVMIAVSVQYLVHPIEVFNEIARVLSPGGKCIVAMSHRLFPTKAIRAFRELSPLDRCQLVASYMNQTHCFEHFEIIDRSPDHADPLWIVLGERYT